MNWSHEQWQQYHAIVDASRKLARQAAEKALRDINEWPCDYLKFANIEDRMGEAIRRGAIELLILQADGKRVGKSENSRGKS